MVAVLLCLYIGLLLVGGVFFSPAVMQFFTVIALFLVIYGLIKWRRNRNR